MKHQFVVLAHGDSAFLPAALDSLVEQKVASKILIVSSGETPYQREIAERYDIQYRVNHRHRNIAGDWNFALEEANAELITLAHQDDIYMHRYSHAILDVMDSRTAMAFTDFFEISGQSALPASTSHYVKNALLLPFWLKNRIASPNLKRFSLGFGNPISCPTVCINRALLQGFHFSEEFTNNLDWYAWLQLAKLEYDFVFIPEKLIRHRLHPEATTFKSLQNEEKFVEDRKIFESLWPKLVSRLIHRFYSFSYKNNLRASSK